MSSKPNYSVPQRFRHVILSILTGIVLALAMPKPGWTLCAWVGLVPLFAAIRKRSWWQAGLLGLLAGTVYYIIILRWVFLFGTLPWLLLSVVEALFVGLFAALYPRLTPERIGWLGYIGVPAAWVAAQFIRTLGTYSFWWGSFAHVQANDLAVSQIASVTGPWGIDFVVCLASLAIAMGAVRPHRRFTPMAAAAVLVSAVYLFGWMALSSPPPHGKGHRVAVVQGSVSEDKATRIPLCQACYVTYSALSVDAARSKPELILWSETAIPDFVGTPGWQPLLSRTALLTKTDLLAGGYERPDDPTRSGCYNSLILFDRWGMKRGAYRKVHLVPFGEFVPLRRQLPFLKDYGVRADDVLSGREHPLLPTRVGSIGASICFESTFPQISRSEVRRGAELLCVVTNDQSLKRTQGPIQHLMMARLRAIENRRFVLRAAGTGISAIVDPYGRIRDRLEPYKKGTIVDEVTPSRSLTPYTRFGDWLAYLSIAVALACALLPSRASQKSSAAKRPRGI